MPTYQLLTDRTLANVTAITPTTLIHIVTTADTTQNIAGSSFKAELQQLSTIFKDTFVTGGTYSSGTATFINSTGGTFNVTGFFTGSTDVSVTGATYSNNSFTYRNNTGGTFSVLFNTVTGLTTNGNLTVTGTTSSSTISATTYQNLPTDVRVTGGTYSAGTISFTNNTGGTFNVTGLTTGSTSTVSGNFLPLSGGTVTGGTIFTDGLTANTISATTYQNLPTDTRVTGSTYNNNTFTSTNNTGGTYSVLFNTVTGLTVNGNLSVTGNTGLGTSSPSTKLQITANNNLNTANNVLRFEDTDTTAANNQMLGKIEFYTSDTTGPGVRSYIAGITDTAGDGKIIFGTALGSDTSLTGGTTTGEKMRIDENGYVGIGTLNPSSKLHINTGDFVIDDIAIRAVNNESTPKGVFMVPVANDDSYNFNTISGDTVIASTGGRSLVIGVGGTGSGFRFSGSPTPTLSTAIITTGARMGIGTVFYTATTEPTETLDVNGNARFRAISAGASAGALHYTSDGTLTTNTSDIRLKDNIQPLEGALEKLLKLTGVTYNWIGQEGKRIGFIAQEVEKVIPELVFTNNNTEDKIKGIHLDNITAVLVEAIKEQQKIIEELKVRISNLES
jgi:hypothetical protein